jgi:AraC family transcriptional regulator
MIRVAEHYYRPGTVQSQHAHGTMGVSIVLAGSVRERVGHAEEIGRVLSVVVKPPGTEHADEFGPTGAHMLRVELDEHVGAELLALERQLAQWRWEHVGQSVPAFLRLLHIMRRIGAGDATEWAAVDVIAALARSLDSGAVGAAPSWLCAVREALDDSGVDMPRVHELAAMAGVHPVYLARRFRRHLGCSITEYAQRLRLQRAATCAADGEAGPLAAVACDAGFFDHAHLCRAFRRATGVTPSAYRTLVRTRT